MKSLLLALMGFILLALAACGQPEDKGGSQGVRQDFGSVRLLTYRYLPQDKAIIDSFQLKYKVRVEVELHSPASLLLQAQQKQLKGDLVMVPKLGDIVRMKSFGILQPFYLNAFSAGNVDDGYMDREGYYAGISRWSMAAVYNPNAVASDEVKTYRSIAQIPLRGIRMGMAHPDSSGLATVVAGLATLVNETGAALWAKMMMEGATPPLAGNDYDQLDRMLAGELDMAFVSASAAVRWLLNGDPQHFAAAEVWRIAYPHTEKDFITLMDVSSLGVLADAPNRDNALKLANYYFQQPNQELICDALFEYPNESFSVVSDFLMNLSGSPNRSVSADMLEDQLPFAYQVINKVAEGQ